MTHIEHIDVLIIGSGPAGMSTALHLVQADPAWAGRILVIDKAIHPREKLCGGGVTRAGESILHELGLVIETPQVPICEVRLLYDDEAYVLKEETPLFRVIRRDEFDHWLVQMGRERGILVREGEAVIDIVPSEDFVEVTTELSTIRAQVVVGADGSRSFVRKKLKWHNSRRMARLLEILTPEAHGEQMLFQDGVALFDFTAIQQGLQGYYWDFPSFVNGQPAVNRGIFDSRVRPMRPHADLKQMLRQALTERQHSLTDYPLKGHPIHWFDRRGQFARPRILMVGDAAGVDPMVGEGISFALGYGPVASAVIGDAFDRQDFSFATYRECILADPLLRRTPLSIPYRSPGLFPQAAMANMARLATLWRWYPRAKSPGANIGAI